MANEHLFLDYLEWVIVYKIYRTAVLIFNLICKQQFFSETPNVNTNILLL